MLKKGKEGWKKGHLASQHEARLLSHSIWMSCYENEEKINQLRPDAIIVTGSLNSDEECLFPIFNKYFHDTDTYCTVLIFFAFWNGYPVLYIDGFNMDGNFI